MRPFFNGNTLKNSIYLQLQNHCPPDALRSWFEPLRLEFDAENAQLTVIFPHVFFEPWFEKHGKCIFEQCSRVVAGANIVFSYSCPSVLQPRPFFLQQNDTKNVDVYSFESVIVNNKNAFPLAAAKEVCNPQARHIYNPFVICGNVGTGKTHLLQTVVYNFTQLRNTNVFSLNAGHVAETFSNIDTYNLLLKYTAFAIDDIQRLAYDLTTQEILVRFMDICLERHCQLIFACTGIPASIKSFSESFRSRLESGLVVEIKTPDIDVRMRFAQEKAQLLGLKLEKAHILLLAQRCTNFRHLGGIILKAAAFWALSHHSITITDIENILHTLGENSSLSSDNIIHTIAEYFNITSTSIMGNKRQPNIVFARQMAMYLCRELLGMSYPTLGKIFGGKDHSTVLYSIKKIKNLLVTNIEMHNTLTNIKNKCITR